MSATDTATRLLDAAQLFVEERGFNAFSYHDLAAEVGIRTASIHYHFRAKADLGQALMERYLRQLDEALAEIDRVGRTSEARLKKFIGLYRETGSRGAICLCGSLASDVETLPESVQAAVRTYLERSERWVATTIEEGARSGELAPSGKPADVAATLVASLQGGLILGRARGGATLLDHVQRTFLASLRPS
ncbi:MAG: TetR/AcrR family transcriptional regulator [Acidobacteriota bacterium]